jgi:hypothetical protein
VAVERAAGATSLIDVLDRVLDKGIVIDAWIRFSLVGINLVAFGSRVIVSSVDCYLKQADQSAPADRRTHADDAQKSPVRRSDDEDDDGSGNTGSSGAPALLYVQVEPRQRPPTRPRRTSTT